MLKNGFVQELVSINDLILDWDNPRLKSKYKEEYRSKDKEDREKILMCNLIAYYDVLELVKDIFSNTDASMHVFYNDLIIVQKGIETKNKYDVKEGNRRTCALKVILSLVGNKHNILYDIEAYMKKENLFDEGFEKKYHDNMLEIINFINNNEGKCIMEIPCNIYNNDEESTIILKNVLRRMHIQKKKMWNAIDKRLFDYDDIVNKIEMGALSVDDAIQELLNEESNITRGKVNIGLLKNQNKEFLVTAFYHFIKQEIQKSKLGDNKRILESRLTNSFLPICDVFRVNLEKTCGIKFYYEIENQKLIYKLKQLPDFYYIKDLNGCVNSCVKKILNEYGKKAINNNKFKNSKLDNQKENKKDTRFWKFFSDILDSYVDLSEMNSLDDSSCGFTAAGIYLKDGLKNSTQKYKIPSDPIELRQNIESVIDTNGNGIKSNAVRIYYEGMKRDSESDKVYIDSQTRSRNILVRYIYTDCNGQDIVAELNYLFYSDKPKNIQKDTKLFEALFPFQKIVIPDIEEQLLSEINKLNIEENKNILSLTMRCMFEISTKSLFEFNCFHKLFKNKDDGYKPMTNCIENLAEFIYSNFSTSKQCEDIAKYYNVNPDIIRNNLTTKTCDYLSTYKKTHASAHGVFNVYSERNILDYGNEAIHWVYIVNYIYISSKSMDC